MFMGRELGKSIDRGDFDKSEEVAQGSMDNNSDGETSTWNNPDSGNSGTITPQTTYKDDDGKDCRDFESTITVDGKTEVAHGRACRQPDGSWKVVN
jgi:surface antigen